MRLSLDFSHVALTKYSLPPFAPRPLAPREIIGAARQLHLRPFNGHHAQIPATNGRGELTVEFRDYLAFVAELFARLQSSARADEVIYACPENGPGQAGGYALSCFPDVWRDAIECGMKRLDYGQNRRVEKGDPTVAMGAYAMALFVLGLGHAFGDLVDPKGDEVGIQLDEARLPTPNRMAGDDA